MKCEYYHCPNEAVQMLAPIVLPGIHLCEKHNGEFTALVQAEPYNAAAIVAWWVVARGGATRLAHEIAGDIESDLKRSGIL